MKEPGWSPASPGARLEPGEPGARLEPGVPRPGAGSGPGAPILRSRFFWKLFASFGAVAVLTGVLVGWQVERRLEQSLLEDLREDLLTDCRILAPFAREVFQGGEDPRLQPELKRLEETGVRITLTRPDGRVIGDSHEDPRNMDDHSNRPEIVQARSEPFGAARRYSHTVGYELLDVAVRVESAGKTVGFVRAGLPVSQIERQLRLTTRSIVLGTAASVLAALVLGVLLSRRITRPIVSMTHTARDLSAGRYESRVHLARADEIGVLGETLNELGAEITRRIAALSQEDAQLRTMLASMIEGVVAVDEQGRIAFVNRAARALLEMGEAGAEGRTLFYYILESSRQARIPGGSRSRGRMAAAGAEAPCAAGIVAPLGARLHRRVAPFRGLARRYCRAGARPGSVGCGRQPALWDLAPIRELEEVLDHARQTGGHELREVELMRGGKERVFQAHASPFHGGGQGGFVLVLHDITELRRLERVRRDFVANVSHELKTPLTSIQGFVETLLSGGLEDQQNNVRFLRTIDANVRRLTNLVSDLLSLARIESGQLVVERTAVDWREVLDGVLRLRGPALSAKGLVLEVVGRERALRARGDREAMTQVLDNLIDNAIQYTNAPGRITVRLAAQDGRAAVAVEDTGIGIPPKDLDRIFERFYRVDKARSRAAGGTGLGLSIVKNLVLRMEGEVTVQSEEGKGSTFTVLLPLA